MSASRRLSSGVPASSSNSKSATKKEGRDPGGSKTWDGAPSKWGYKIASITGPSTTLLASEVGDDILGRSRSVHDFEKLNRLGEGTYGIVCKSPLDFGTLHVLATTPTARTDLRSDLSVITQTARKTESLERLWL
jgi:hypothetical protein